jgi:magnesium-transporting ATPase (P-type)
VSPWSQVAASRAKHGFNELDKEEGKPLWKMVLEQFDDALVKARPRGQPSPAEPPHPRPPPVF